jgi:PhnB protein
MRGIVPYLQFKNTSDAIAWYENVFEAKEIRDRLVAPDGKCMNAEIEIEGSRLMLADEMSAVGSSSPETLGGTSIVLNLHVADADAVFQKALHAGANIVFPIADQFYGDRAGRVRDPFGHHWIIASQIHKVSGPEMLKRFSSLF